jgi:hypothetical protein
VYDHLQPATWPDTLGKEPLFAWLLSGRSSVGLTDRSHDVPKISREIGVVGLDVQPPLFGQNNAAAVGVPYSSDHVVKIEDRPDGAWLERHQKRLPVGQ